jgi:hypothetical protein
MRIFSATTLALLALAGCAQAPVAHVGSKEIVDCCAAIQTKSTVSLATGMPSRVELADGMQKYRFTQGISLAGIFALPENSVASSFIVRTKPHGIFVGTTDVFCPVVTFLSKANEIVGFSGDLSLGFYRESLADYHGFYYSVIKIPAGASKVVVHTSDETLKHGVPHNEGSSGYVSFAGKTPIYVDSGYRGGFYPCVATGTIEVEVR